MSLSLEKKQEKVGLILKKKSIEGVPCQVKCAIDKSGSMEWLYDNGTVQQIVERVLAISLNVDMDGNVDIWAFHSSAYEVGTAKKPLIEHYVEKEIENKVGWGSTKYAPPMKEILESSKATEGKKGFLGFGKTAAKPADPTLAIFITDGENDSDDKGPAEKVIKESQGENIYWLLIGIGSSGNFKYIEQLGEKYPNCGYVGIRNIDTIDDESMFEAMFNEELVAWFNKFKK